MEPLFQQLLDWVTAYPGWTYGILFLSALAESLAIVGMIVPGVVLMVGAGALIAAGVLDLWIAWPLVTLGAILGDTLSYALGRHLKGHAREIWPFKRHPASLQRGERFFARFGAKSVVFGRFVGPVRAIVPMVAGMMGMAPGRFLVANVLSAIAWAPAYLLPGLVFGASLKLAAEAAARLVIFALILLLVLWLSAWAARRLFLLLSPRAGVWLSALLRWADVHPSMGKIALALADPKHPDAAILTSLAGLLILATLLLGALIGVMLIGPSELAINQAALDFGQSLHTPPTDALMIGLSRLGDPVVILVLVALVFSYLRWRRRTRHASYWLAATGFALVAAPALGWLLHVPRPAIGLTGLSPWSFPSVPVLGATVAYGFLAVALARGLPASWRWVPYVIATLLVTAVVIARLYLGAEWLTDVAATVALGVSWIALLGLAFRRHSRFDLRWPRLATVAVTALAIGFTVRTLMGHRADLARYTPTRQPISITEADWRAGRWSELPSARIDTWQRNRHPLDLQYAGPLPPLAERLATCGWQPAEQLDWHNALRLLSPTLPLRELPLIPHIHDGQHEALALTKDSTDCDRRLVLRLWSTPYRIDPSTPLWVGNVTSQHKETLVGLIVLPITDDGPRRVGESLAEQPVTCLATSAIENRPPALLRVPITP